MEKTLVESEDVLNNWKLTLALRACAAVNRVNDARGPLTAREVDDLIRFAVERDGPAATRDFHRRVFASHDDEDDDDDGCGNGSSSSSSGCCAICLEAVTGGGVDGNGDGELAMTLPCRHTFHVRCFAQWGLQSSQGIGASCPLCRRVTTTTTTTTIVKL